MITLILHNCRVYYPQIRIKYDVNLLYDVCK
jgi:hypothetical protein